MITWLAIMVSAIFVTLTTALFIIAIELTKIREAIEAYVYEDEGEE